MYGGSGNASADRTAPQRRLHAVPERSGATPRGVTLALIEDNRVVRDGITALLHQHPDLEVVAATSSADLSLLERVQPHVVLLDLGLHNGDSLLLAERIRDVIPGARVVIMDLLPVHEEIMEFVHAGVAGFIMKDATIEELVTTIRSVADGIDVLPPQMTSSLFSEIARKAIAQGQPEACEDVRMTPRERQVVNLIAEGLSNKQIAARLHIATHTVKSHVRNIMEKLTLHTRLQIAAYSHRQDAP